MKFSIAQIGENRLKRVLVEDKQNNPQRLCDVLKSDIKNVLDCYVENSQVEIQSYQSEEGVTFAVTIKCTRVKSFGVLA